MNLISRTHHSCERKEYAFIVLREYTIISLTQNINERAIKFVVQSTSLYDIYVYFCPCYLSRSMKLTQIEYKSYEFFFFRNSKFITFFIFFYLFFIYEFHGSRFTVYFTVPQILQLVYYIYAIEYKYQQQSFVFGISANHMGRLAMGCM